MIIRRNNVTVSQVTSNYIGKEIIVAIDSSKRNSAFTIGDLSRRVLDYYEFNGALDGTTEVDTLVLCQKQRKALQVIFAGAKPKFVGIENIITKKDPTKERNGMTEHSARFKITAVFMSFITFFQDTFQITPELINNWSWKSTVLPEKYRTKDYKKGSLAYFKDIGSPLGKCSDDVTDSICIYLYLCKIHGITSKVKIDAAEISRHPYTVSLVTSKWLSEKEALMFEYNSSLSLKQNADVISNNINSGVYGIAVVSVDELSWEDIYTYCKGTFEKKEPKLNLVVERRV